MSNKEKDPLKAFLAGGFGGACKVFVGHPFETIKIRLQTNCVMSPGYSGPITTLGCLRQTISAEGFKMKYKELYKKLYYENALYKGMSAPLLLGMPFSAIYFGGCAFGRWLILRKDSEKQRLSFIDDLRVGSLAGGFTSLVAVPVDRIKAILQVQRKIEQFNGPLDVLRKLYAKGGMLNVYRGTTVTVLKGMSTGAIYMGIYDLCKRRLSPSEGISNSDKQILFTVAILSSGAIAGVIAAFICTPIDMLKSRIQASHSPDRYPSGMRSVIKEIRKSEEGKTWTGFVRTFYKGLVPIVIRIIPSNAAYFFGMEAVLYALNYQSLEDCLENPDI